MRTITAGLLAGITLFVWGWIAHLPPLGTAGEQTLPPPAAAALASQLHDRAVYIAPPFAGPSAVVAYNPNPPRQAAVWFGIELLSDLIVGILGAFIAASLSTSLGYWRRVFALGAIGLLATIDIDAGYWNWYGYPTSYLGAQLVDHAGGWLAAGMILARLTTIDTLRTLAKSASGSAPRTTKLAS